MKLSRPRLKKTPYISGGNFSSLKNKKSHSEKAYVFSKNLF